MSRLTEQLDNGVVTLKKGMTDENIQEALCVLADYEDIGLNAERVAILTAAGEDNRIFISPVKIGATVYQIGKFKGVFIIKPRMVYGVEFKNNTYTLLFDGAIGRLNESNLGKWWFFTRAEAETALTEREKK